MVQFEKNFKEGNWNYKKSPESFDHAELRLQITFYKGFIGVVKKHFYIKLTVAATTRSIAIIVCLQH